MQELAASLVSVFGTAKFMPHGYCLYWQPELLYMHMIADLTIALAYFSIPITIVVLLRQRRQVLPYRWVFVSFAVFIFLCGASHLVELVTLWYPVYYFEALIKVATATVSLATALLLFPLIRELLDRFQKTDSAGPAGGKDPLGWRET